MIDLITIPCVLLRDFNCLITLGSSCYLSLRGISSHLPRPFVLRAHVHSFPNLLNPVLSQYCLALIFLISIWQDFFSFFFSFPSGKSCYTFTSFLISIQTVFFTLIFFLSFRPFILIFTCTLLFAMSIWSHKMIFASTDSVIMNVYIFFLISMHTRFPLF